MTALPGALAAALDRQLDGVSRSRLGDEAASLSKRYRQGAGNHADSGESLAYAVTRLPATYAAARAVLAELQARAPGFAPASLLDLGSGPGTAAWAALDAFPGIESINLIERAASFRTLGRALASEAEVPLANAAWHDIDLERGDALAPLAGSFDLVTACFSLVEISAAHQASLLRQAYARTSGALVLIDPGTPAGHERMLAARAVLLTEGAEVLAPCPGPVPCPLAPPDWCHAAVRLPRRRDHRLTKRASMAYEDEKYAYLIVARASLGQPAAARVLRQPDPGKAGVRVLLCTETGVAEAHVPSRDRPAHKLAGKWAWGDGLNDMAPVNGRLEKPRPGRA